MKKKIDVRRVKEILKNLNQIAKDHPELNGESSEDEWTETLQDIFFSPNVVFTVQEVAEILKVHVETVRRAIRSGKLKAAKIGKDYRVSNHDLENYYVKTGGCDVDFSKCEPSNN